MSSPIPPQANDMTSPMSGSITPLLAGPTPAKGPAGSTPFPRFGAPAFPPPLDRLSPSQMSPPALSSRRQQQQQQQQPIFSPLVPSDAGECVDAELQTILGFSTEHSLPPQLRLSRRRVPGLCNSLLRHSGSRRTPQSHHRPSPSASPYPHRGGGRPGRGASQRPPPSHAQRPHTSLQPRLQRGGALLTAPHSPSRRSREDPAWCPMQPRSSGSDPERGEAWVTPLHRPCQRCSLRCPPQ